MTHRTRVITGMDSSIPTCSCGWTGKDWMAATAARREANQHEIDAMHAKQTPAKTK